MRRKCLELDGSSVRTANDAAPHQRHREAMSSATSRESSRFAATLSATSLAALLATVGLFWAPAAVEGEVAGATTRPSSHCARRGPAGASERAAGVVIERFLHTTVVGIPGGCGSSTLAVAGLAPARYETRLPQRVDGWYQLAPRVRNAKGLWEYAGFLWVDAPDADAAAFEFLLELHGNRWLVSSFVAAPGSAEVDPAKMPT
jgi:hypothetical protein